MTPQERSLIEQVAGQLAAHPLSHKDADADTLIQEQIGSQPDALYRMTQVQIIQQMTLEAAQRKLADLQRQLQGYQQQGVMGRMFGSRPDIPPPPPPPEYQPSAFGGFLRSAGTIAAGVAAGSLLADAVGGLFDRDGSSSWSGNGSTPEVVENITENNFLDPDMLPVDDSQVPGNDNPASDDGFLPVPDDDTAVPDTGNDDDFDDGQDDNFI
ncbi:hypothetical protein A9J41_13405 [Laribacter hongkongensis]|uniref:DUF2076 domain-containing protein n=1 Tax=Laribacter hongkongensis TaxID=168471 RepID=UPI001877E786|nr:DUF2076 family protein [Laribacter hongkongensis]MBE5528739.1 hypothetical protein [Laribacter hongkongensis]